MIPPQRVLRANQKLRPLYHPLGTRGGTTDEAVVVELNRIGVDFTGLCRNLNQIAKNNNSGRSLGPNFPVVLAEAESMMAEIKELISKVKHGS